MDSDDLFRVSASFKELTDRHSVLNRGLKIVSSVIPRISDPWASGCGPGLPVVPRTRIASPGRAATYNRLRNRKTLAKPSNPHRIQLGLNLLSGHSPAPFATGTAIGRVGPSCRGRKIRGPEGPGAALPGPQRHRPGKSGSRRGRRCSRRFPLDEALANAHLADVPPFELRTSMPMAPARAAISALLTHT